MSDGGDVFRLGAVAYDAKVVTIWEGFTRYFARHGLRFRALLLQMRYADAEVRPLLDLEGLKRWEEGRVSGYALLERAVDRFRYLEPWLTRMTVS